MGRIREHTAIIKKKTNFKLFSFKVEIVIFAAVLLVSKLNTKFFCKKVEWIKLTNSMPNLRNYFFNLGF
jgi:hypothetical protein